MANRRMFSKTITQSDKFLSMGSDVQMLYFHLGMEADDDGFVSPRRVMRMIGAADDSLRHLVAKGLIIPFESGVVVVTDWKEHNYIQSDRYKRTQYTQEMAQLSQNNGMYTKCIQDVHKMATEIRIGEDRISTADAVKFLPSKVEEVRVDKNGDVIEVKKPKKPTGDPLWPLFIKCVALLESDAGHKIITTGRDFEALKKAHPFLDSKDRHVLDLVEELISRGQALRRGFSLARLFSAADLNRYKSEYMA